MGSALIDPRRETRALRRTQVLLSRVRQDSRSAGDIDTLEEVIGELSHAVEAGKLLDLSVIERLEGELASAKEPAVGEGHVRVADLLLQNAFVEAHELIARLRAPVSRTTRPTTSRGRTSTHA